nr:immunoglobulin light chain junction region [Macaca mulatta]
DYNWVF